ncbi:hypothetical protein [Candidatus Sneabacter namystus]|uniref:Uncharacterized protein n=1 Tax=Candidatus Sneabacter namystus TaxID=2601646 RepID=A0A5C0UIZ2_9RICK|nr:hypothetical protein [Candidatus Sneabacter namystus]QEK39759.1 hypothetical protein FZC37_02370 [Candidatus Sneabacter namystus]
MTQIMDLERHKNKAKGRYTRFETLKRAFAESDMGRRPISDYLYTTSVRGAVFLDFRHIFGWQEMKKAVDISYTSFSSLRQMITPPWELKKFQHAFNNLFRYLLSDITSQNKIQSREIFNAVFDINCAARLLKRCCWCTKNLFLGPAKLGNVHTQYMDNGSDMPYGRLLRKITHTIARLVQTFERWYHEAKRCVNPQHRIPFYFKDNDDTPLQGRNRLWRGTIFRFVEFEEFLEDGSVNKNSNNFGNLKSIANVYNQSGKTEYVDLTNGAKPYGHGLTKYNHEKGSITYVLLPLKIYLN